MFIKTVWELNVVITISIEEIKTTEPSKEVSVKNMACRA
jgi:hypothetical protein